MELTIDQIKEIILKPRAGAAIASALAFQKKHKLHMCGEGYSDWLKEFASVESKRTIKKKEKLCRPKTPAIYKQIRIQYEKIFRAKGNVVNYNFKGETNKQKKKEFVDYLRTCANGMSLNEFMRQIWHESMFQEFNGFIGVELKTKEELEEAGKNVAQPVIALYPLATIHDVGQKGYDLQYIAINTEIQLPREIEKRKAYRIIDGKYDAIYYMDGENVKLYVRPDGLEDKIPMKFKKIPFIQVSRYRLAPSDDFSKSSPVGITMDDADIYLSISDDHIVSVKAHQHPIFFSFPAMCGVCQGTGNKYLANGDVDGVCGTCYGRKEVNIMKTDISEGFTLPRVESDEGGSEAAQPPCGYVTPDLESLKEQRTEMEFEKKAIEIGSLGVEGLLTVSDTGEKETAFKAELDTQPLFDTLNSYSKNAEAIEEFLTDRMGEIMYESAWMGSHIHYGRKYFLRSESDVMNELKLAYEAGVPRTYIIELLEELYWIRFAGNPKALHRALLKLLIEPLPETNLVSDITGLQAFITEEKLILKTNINDYIERYEAEVGHLEEFDENGNFDARKSADSITLKIKTYVSEDQESIRGSEKAKADLKAKSNGKSGAVVEE